jgi:hypothetical protein
MYIDRLLTDLQIDHQTEYTVKIKNHKNMFLQGYLVEKEGAKRTVICLHALLKSSSSLVETVKFLMDIYDDANFLLFDANNYVSRLTTINYYLFFIGIFVIEIGYILQKAVKIKEEQDLTI